VPGMKYRHYSPKAKVVLYEPNTQPPDVSKLLASLDPTASASIGIIRTRMWAPNWSSKLSLKPPPSLANGSGMGTEMWRHMSMPQ